MSNKKVLNYNGRKKYEEEIDVVKSTQSIIQEALQYLGYP